MQLMESDPASPVFQRRSLSGATTVNIFYDKKTLRLAKIKKKILKVFLRSSSVHYKSTKSFRFKIFKSSCLEELTNHLLFVMTLFP